MAAPALAAAAAHRRSGRAPAGWPWPRPAWPYVLAALARTSGRSLLAVAPGDDEARDLSHELIALLGRGAVALWPTRGVPAGGVVGASPHLVGQRARALATLGRPGTVVVAGAPAVAERDRGPTNRREPMEVTVGETVSLDELVTGLIALGYERTAQVEERGDLAVRGGILDVYPSTADLPARIELFGDEVESMRAFSPFTQRTIRPIERVLAWAAAEQPGETRRLASGPRTIHGCRCGNVRLDPGEHTGRPAGGAGALRGRGRGRRPQRPGRGRGPTGRMACSTWCRRPGRPRRSSTRFRPVLPRVVRRSLRASSRGWPATATGCS